MGYVYRRGKKWNIAFTNSEGELIRRLGGKTKGEAEAVLRDVESLMEEVAPPEEETFEEVAYAWLARRQRRKLKMSTSDRSYLQHHIIPFLGHREPSSIKVRDIRAFVAELQEKDLAPRTVRNIYASLRKLFNDLVVEEIVDSTPCVLSKDHLPRNVDADPEWRAGAVFTAEEVNLLLDGELPDEGRMVDVGARRLLYAIGFYTGARVSEILALRWRHIFRAKPLNKLVIARSLGGTTKTGVTRQIPIHPELGRRLTAWSEEGWERYQGRSPKADDIILPTFNGLFMHKSTALNRLKRDLLALDLRQRRLHDTRRTFISIALECGARRDVLKRMTHTSTSDMIDLYTAVSWPEMCKAMACLDYGSGGILGTGKGWKDD